MASLAKIYSANFYSVNFVGGVLHTCTMAVFREASVLFEDPLLLEEVQRMHKDVLKACS